MGAGIAKQTAKGLTDRPNLSREGDIAVCTVPETESKGHAIERAVLAVNMEM